MPKRTPPPGVERIDLREGRGTASRASRARPERRGSSAGSVFLVLRRVADLRHRVPSWRLPSAPRWNVEASGLRGAAARLTRLVRHGPGRRRPGGRGLGPVAKVGLGLALLAAVAAIVVAYAVHVEAAARARSMSGSPYVFVAPPTSADAATSADALDEAYAWPIATVGRVTSCFGSRRLFGAMDNHQGLDIAARRGTPVLAARSGAVEHFWVSTAPTGYGTHVVLEHPDGMHTLYAHLEPELQLTRNQSLEQGAILGYSGNTGFSTGPHLHFEILDANGVTQNPAQFLDTRLRSPIFRESDDSCWPRDVLAWDR